MEQNLEVVRAQLIQDVEELKASDRKMTGVIERMREDIRDLKTSEKLQDFEINSLKATLSEIKDDTSWIRKKFTGALITAVITAIVGGIIGIAITNTF